MPLNKFREYVPGHAGLDRVAAAGRPLVSAIRKAEPGRRRGTGVPRIAPGSASLGLLLLAACSANAPSEEVQVEEASSSQQRLIPAGAKVEPSGFLTIEQVPPMPLPPPEPPEPRPTNEAGWYAQMAGISEAEARKRLAEQQAVREELERVIAEVRRREAGNFTAVRMIHRPDWAYVFYFKRDPQRTLAKYTRNPHFRAAKAQFTEKELRAIAEPWIERFQRHRMLDGYGVDATYGEIRISLAISEGEYRQMAEREGWGALPEPIELEFSAAPEGEAVPERVRPLIRIFPHRDRALGSTNLALHSGRITLRDGCFYVGGPDGSAKLAYFPREFGLAIDDEGYLAIRSRVPSRPGETGGRLIGRVGEEFVWGGPIHMDEDLPMVRELRDRCGSAQVVHVGMLTSARAFERRYGVQTRTGTLDNPPPPPRSPAAPPQPPAPPGR